MPVDRQARDEFARAFRLLVTRRISDREFCTMLDALPKTEDPAVREAFDVSWALTEDTDTEDKVPPLTPEARRYCASWLLFLKSDLEYEWPVTSVLANVGLTIASIATVGLAGWLYCKWRESKGPWEIEPFVRRSDLQAAMVSCPADLSQRCPA